MIDRARFDEALDALSAAGGNLRCNDLARTLRGLGFDVRDGRKAGHKVMTHPGIAPSYIASAPFQRTGHKVMTHPGIARFSTAGYTCGHGKNPEIKPVYVKKMIGLLRDYESDLVAFLRESR